MPTDRLEAGCLDHGYARINYKTQGATADRIFALGGDGDRQAAYTALSRGRVENRLYLTTPDHDLFDPNPAEPGRQLLLDHAERELSRDRSQHLASELLANLPEPTGTPTADDHAAGLLAQIPEPDPQRVHPTLADDLLAAIPEPDDIDPDLAERVAKITARLDRLQHARGVDDGFGIDR